MKKTITFDEYSTGTVNPSWSFDDNMVTSTGVIISDRAQPQSPVIAANYSYKGPVFIYFENPVQSVSVDVGYFDNLGSTRVEFRDAAGNIVASYANTDYGVVTFSFSSDTGIRSVGAIDYSFDDAGFSLDTVVFGPPVSQDQPPVVSYSAGPVLSDRDFGFVSESRYSFSDTLGGTDLSDAIQFMADREGKILFTSYLADNPGRTAEFSFDFKAGLNSFTFKPGSDYDTAEGYTVTFSILFEGSDKEKAMDELISDLLADILGGTLDYKSKQFEIFEQLSRAVDGAADGALLLSKFAKAFGVLGLTLDVANRADNIYSAADPARQTFIEFVDMLTGIAATGAVGLGLSAVGTPIAGIIGGFATGIVYTIYLSDGVKSAAGGWYDSLAGGAGANSTGPVPMGLVHVGSEVAALDTLQAEPDLTPFILDVDYYLATYADAREAVASGEAASAYLHYLAVGLPAGYKPNAEAEPIDPKTVSLLPSPAGAASGYHSSVFTQPIGELAGDAGSAAELDFVAYLNELRTDGSEFLVDATLSALANRIARDWATNHGEAPHLAYDPASVTSWAQTLSSGQDFREALARLAPGSLVDARIVAAYSEAMSAESIYRALSTTAEASSLLLGLDNKAIGIAEYGGMHVVLLLPNAIGGTLQAEIEPAVVRLFGGEDQDILFAGAAPGRLYGGDGADELQGGAFGDVLDGEAGDDFLSGGQGDDLLYGGDGDDTLVGGQGSDTLDGGDGRDVVDLSGTGRRGAEFAVGADGSTLLTRDGETDHLFAIEEVVYADGRMVFDEDDAAAQLLRLYNAAFDRSHDQGGLNYWMDRLESGDGLDWIASAFARSGEFARMWSDLDDGGFVQRLYAHALGRKADEDGLAYWVDQLQDGRGRHEVLLAVSESPEHRDVTREQVQSGIWDVDEAAAQVARLYHAAFDRLPDLPGLQVQVTAIGENDASLEDIVQSWMGTAGFEAIYGSLDNAGFVQRLYATALEREAAAPEVEYWASLLDNAGMTRAEVLVFFSESAEHRAITLSGIQDEEEHGIAFA